MKINKPNIFDLATKELTQDAFLTWLLLHADPNCVTDDPSLIECGQDFIKAMIKLQIPDFDDEILKVDAGRQFENIDVWAKINDQYFIIIEDKINTSHHSDQLPRYKDIAEDWCLKNSYLQPICIYLKTGNESKANLDGIKRLGYSIFSRRNLLDILDHHKDIVNDIFVDFHERLSRIEQSNSLFESKELSQWNGNDWQGFYQFLERNVGLINWKYVNNPNGGFWCAVMNWEAWGSIPLYLQIEEGQLCFKVSTHPGDVNIPDTISKKEIRSLLHKSIIERAKKCGFNDIRKPNRFGHGNYMTVAIVEKKDWLGLDNSKLDKQAVTKTLRSYKLFIKDMCSEKKVLL